MKNPCDQSKAMSAEGQGVLPKSVAWLILGVSAFFFLSSCEPAHAKEVWKITAYCACQKCCGKTDGITASGKKAKPNHTVALNWLPFGTKVDINGKVYTVEDRGAESHFGTYYHRKGPKNKIKHIDIFFNDHQTAKQHGVKWLPVEVL